MKIRPYEQKDREAVRYICLNCDGPSTMPENTEHFILTTYCDYYIEKEPDNCFVATDDSDKAIGYIICTEDFDKFIEIFRNEYITRIPEDDKQHRFYATASAVLQGKHKDEYPAHFHIDILPEYHRQGIGHKLTDTLKTHLKSKNVPGMMLCVSTVNLQGNSFYKKYGFSLIESTPADNAYGMKL